MSLHIGDLDMKSDGSPHAARKHPDTGRWSVSWLPGRDLSRRQAVVAMRLADTACSPGMTADSPKWAAVDDWSAELGLSGPDAVSKIAEATLDIALAYMRRPWRITEPGRRAVSRPACRWQEDPGSTLPGARFVHSRHLAPEGHQASPVQQIGAVTAVRRGPHLIFPCETLCRG